MGPWPKPEILQVAPWLVTPEPRDNQFWLVANATCTSFILQWPPKSLPQMACNLFLDYVYVGLFLDSL